MSCLQGDWLQSRSFVSSCRHSQICRRTCIRHPELLARLRSPARNVHARGTSLQAAQKVAPTMAEAQLPKTYKRLVAKHTGNSFREVATVEEWDLKAPGDGEVLVKIENAGINGGCETFRVRAEHAFASNKGKRSFPLGAEAAGTIAALGPNVNNLKVGDAVAVTGAGYTEYAIAKAALCYPVREPSAEAVAVSLSGLTAACALLVKGEVKEGETVLVTAAAGGTGHFGVQIAKLKGCMVVATCGSNAKAQLLKDLGANRVINYHEEDVRTILKREFPQGIDLAYEGVGGAMLETALENLAPQGRVLSVGYISSYPHTHSAEAVQDVGAEPSSRQVSTVDGWDLPPPEELFWKGLEVRRGNQIIFGSVWPKDGQKIQVTKRWLFEQFYDGKIRACIDPKRFHGLEQVPAAIDYMLSGQSIGKVIASL